MACIMSESIQCLTCVLQQASKVLRGGFLDAVGMRVVSLPSYRSMLHVQRESLTQRLNGLVGSSSSLVDSSFVHSLYVAANNMLFSLPSMRKVMKGLDPAQR